MNREKVKTIILTMLVVISIFLTQKIWFISPITMMQSEASNLGVSQEKILEERKELLKPNRFTINLGGYYVNPAYNDDIWLHTKALLEDYFVGEPEITPSSIENYEEQKGLKSIEVHFGDNIPSVLVSSIFDSLDNRVVKNIKEVQSILIPAVSNGDIYILSDGAVFKITQGNNNIEILNAIFQYIESQSYNRFYPLFADIGSPVLMPLSFNNVLPPLHVESDIDITQDSIVVEHAKTFFDRNFDFIKTIKETSGSTVFIYGYGEKSVRVNNKGRVEYSEDVGTTTNTNIIRSLDVAIDFVLKHSEFPEDTYLKEIKPIEKNKGYYFGFGYKLNDRPLYFLDNSTNPIELEVYGDRVRNYKSLIRNSVDTVDVEGTKQMMLPHKIIDNSFEMIKNDYLSSQGQGYEESVDEVLLNEIRSVNLVYLDPVDRVSNQVVAPAWEIIISGNAYFFNAYDGQLVYKTVTN